MKNKKSLRRFWGAFLVFILLFVGILLWFSAKWYSSVYGRLGFDAILFTLSSLQGAASDLIVTYLLDVLVPALLVSAVLTAIFCWHPARRLTMTLFGKHRFSLYPLPRLSRWLLVSVLTLSFVWSAAWEVQLPQYLNGLLHPATIYEDHYVDPKTADIAFPEQKRNLIYIFLESMESTFLSQEHGGGLPQTVIPELYTLAQENTNFSFHSDVGGFLSPPGTNWTVGAMVAQTCGIPLKTPPGVDGNGYGQHGEFLPGVTALGDILHENGYRQGLMFGSDADFGGRKTLFETHGTETVWDLYTAREDGTIPEDYLVWWGFEDAKLFPYAQEKILELASSGEPFAFTMLTADTHHIDGYRCPDCPDTYHEQYENVLACSSRKVTEFVRWIQSQDFYENTTIVICGDHPTMDNGYITRNLLPGSDRRVYNCIVNPAVSAENSKNRQFATFDLFPTTLSALGCQIPGHRLGLGTDLFSSTPTLIEELGLGYVNNQLNSMSPFYNREFLQYNY